MHDYNQLVGGACQLFYDEVKLLKRKGHQVHVFTLNESMAKKAYLENIDHQTIYHEPRDPSIAHFFQKYFSWKIYQSFKQTIKEFQPNIIHIHNNLKSSLSIILASKHCQIPIVHTLHDANLLCISSYGINKTTGELCLNGSLINCFANKCFPLSKFVKHAGLWKTRQWIEKHYINAILCPSKFLMETLRKLGYKNLEYLPYFIDWDSQKRSKQINMHKNSPYILYAGRLIQLKGIPYLLEAFKIVLKTKPEFKLVIAGGGQEMENLKFYASELSVAEKVIFLNKVPHETLFSLYQKASLTVLPSIGLENSPLSIIESFSAGTPVVASNVGGIPELIINGKTGYLSKPKNTQDLADKILKLARNPLLAKRVGMKAQNFYYKEYNEKQHYKKLMLIYKQTINSHSL